MLELAVNTATRLAQILELFERVVFLAQSVARL